MEHGSARGPDENGDERCRGCGGTGDEPVDRASKDAEVIHDSRSTRTKKRQLLRGVVACLAEVIGSSVGGDTDPAVTINDDPHTAGRWFLMYALPPAWVVAGFADDICHAAAEMPS